MGSDASYQRAFQGYFLIISNDDFTQNDSRTFHFDMWLNIALNSIATQIIRCDL